MAKKVLLLTLHTFSLTGGIEKVCRTLAKVLSNAVTNQQLKSCQLISMYDNQADNNYIDNSNFKGYKGNKIRFALASFFAIAQNDVVILSHIHLLFFVSLFKKILPKKRIILLAHGIEVWQPLSKWKLNLLQQIEIWAVSNYTATRLKELHHITSRNIKVIHNGLDPFFKTEQLTRQHNKLTKHYQLTNEQTILLTICRLSSLEKYKGYDAVLLALKDLVKTYPNLVYFILGKADEQEKARVTELIANYNLANHVYLTGFVSDEELQHYYQLADIFVMPSTNEGFGLVFIEAAANGCAVIAGNKDGSVDALRSGELGTLVDPEDIKAIYKAIEQQMLNKFTPKETTQLIDRTYDYFGFPNYQTSVLKQLLT